MTLFRWRETEREGAYGATTLIASFLTFALGAYAVLGDMVAAAAAAVATAGLLAAKGWLHSWIKALSWEELRATLTLLAMTFVALPVLPDRGFGPYGALNPYQLWLMTIVIAGVAFGGYVAVKVAGGRYGALIAGVSGGLVSSTATTLDLARKAKAGFGKPQHLLAGALAASATMFVRVGVVVALFGPHLLPRLAAPLAAAAVVLVAAALFLAAPWTHEEEEDSRARRRRAHQSLRAPLGSRLRCAARRRAGSFQGGDADVRRRGWRRPCRRCRHRRRRRDHAVDDPACGCLGARRASSPSSSRSLPTRCRNRYFRSSAEGAALRSSTSPANLVAIAAAVAMFFAEGRAGLSGARDAALIFPGGPASGAHFGGTRRQRRGLLGRGEDDQRLGPLDAFHGLDDGGEERLEHARIADPDLEHVVPRAGDVVAFEHGRLGRDPLEEAAPRRRDRSIRRRRWRADRAPAPPAPHARESR